MRANRNGFRLVRGTALAGVCAALLECAKWVLSGLPNVEIVTLLTALFGYCFGERGVLAAVGFVAIEPLLYGFGTWTVSYLLYWTIVAALFWLLGKKHVQNRWLLTAVAVLLTVWFGVLTSLVDVVIYTGVGEGFFSRFAPMYARGVWFYVTQIACNAVLFPLLFPLLAARLNKLKLHFSQL